MQKSTVVLNVVFFAAPTTRCSSTLTTPHCAQAAPRLLRRPNTALDKAAHLPHNGNMETEIVMALELIDWIFIIATPIVAVYIMWDAITDRSEK